MHRLASLASLASLDDMSKILTHTPRFYFLLDACGEF